VDRKALNHPNKIFYYDMSDSFSIIHDSDVRYLTASDNLQIPVASISGLGAPVKGEVGYNTLDNKIYYANGVIWQPISIGGGGGGNTTSFSLVKNSVQIISPTVQTILTDWSSTPQPPFHDQTGNWNLSTGVYTASVLSTLTINACIAWSAGINNLGYRTVNIFYKPVAGLSSILKQTMTQANPSTNVETTQETTTTALMNPGDQIWVSVMHNSNTNLNISNSISTTLSGILIIV
jgi:hypothetical protein